MIYEINRGTHKLVQTPMLIKKQIISLNLLMRPTTTL